MEITIEITEEFSTLSEATKFYSKCRNLHLTHNQEEYTTIDVFILPKGNFYKVVIELAGNLNLRKTIQNHIDKIKEELDEANIQNNN